MPGARAEKCPGCVKTRFLQQLSIILGLGCKNFSEVDRIHSDLFPVGSGALKTGVFSAIEWFSGG